MFRDKKQPGDNNPFNLQPKLQAAQKATNNLLMLIQQRKNQQYFQLLTCQNQIIYLDQQKRYAIVQSRYLQELEQRSTKTKQQVQKISQQIKTQSLNQISFNKITSLKDKEIQSLKQEIKLNVSKIRQLQQVIRNQEEMLNFKEKEIQKCIRNYSQKFNQVKRQAQSLLIMASFYQANSKHTQTQKQENYSIRQIVVQSVNKFMGGQNRRQIEQNLNDRLSHNEVIYKSQIQKQSILVKRHEQQMQRLKQNFRRMLQQITQKVSLKLKELEKQKLDIKKWSDQNKKLKQQNNQLRLTIRHINQQEQKIKIWKNTLQNFLENVQSDYKNSRTNYGNLRSIVPETYMHNQQQRQNKNTENEKNFKYLNEQKIRMMQAAIDRIKAEQRQRNNKMVQIKQLLDSDDMSKISEENIVGNLVNLSAKIKEVIKFLLQDI